MKKQIIIGIVGICLVLVTIGVYFVKTITKQTASREKSSKQLVEVVSVDAVISNPGHYRGFIGVEGTVISIDESKNIFLLGCKDVCISMPVHYKGQMPKPQSGIIVYGGIKKQDDGRYVFEGKEVKSR